ncbi:MAG TPA: hypothetical protein VF522_11360 [Ramlibacter sp.]|uniref:hypothetical protein n=1 Tax=Ramlibacter sp. TaxID=1917967 RepID=UPI002ED234BF
MPKDTTAIPAPDTAPDKDKRDSPALGDHPAPHAGRTGVAGARAERPAEGRRNGEVPAIGRGAKAPSAKEEKGEAKRDDDLPKPVRDSTT